jgi:hypothetical protein
MRIVALGLLVGLLTGSASLADGVTPTTEWINIYSTNSTLDDEPLPVGASVAVFDSRGARCGEYTVTTEGWYGLMPCYRDDPMTSRDEGAVVGDVLHFTVNHRPAAATAIRLNGTAVQPSTAVRWTANGDRWEVDLQLHTPPVGGYTLPAGRATLPWSRGALLVAVIGFVITAVALLGRRPGKEHHPAS